jgi:hypothetical protein
MIGFALSIIGSLLIGFAPGGALAAYFLLPGVRRTAYQEPRRPDQGPGVGRQRAGAGMEAARPGALSWPPITDVRAAEKVRRATR